MSDEKLDFRATLLLPWIYNQAAKSCNWHDLEFHLKQAEAGVTRGRQVKMKENVQSGAQTPARLPAFYLALVESVINPPF